MPKVRFMDSPCALNLITEGRPSRRSVTVNTVGDLFTYDPRTTDSSLVGFTGRLPFRYRLIHLNSAGNVITTGNWVSYPIVIDGIATTSGLSLSGFSLVRDTGTSIVDRVTTDPRIQATLVGNRAGATVRIEFDQQGNGKCDSLCGVSVGQ